MKKITILHTIIISYMPIGRLIVYQDQKHPFFFINQNVLKRPKAQGVPQPK